MPYAKLNVGRTLAGSDRLTFAAADYTHGLDEDRRRRSLGLNMGARFNW